MVPARSEQAADHRRVDFDDWQDLRIGQTGRIFARITGRAADTLIIENADWSQNILANPRGLSCPASTRSYVDITIQRTEDGMTAIAIEPTGETQGSQV